MVEVTSHDRASSNDSEHRKSASASEWGLLVFTFVLLLFQLVLLVVGPYEGVSSLTGVGLSTALVAIAIRPFMRHRAGRVVIIVTYLAGMTVTVLGLLAN